MSTALPAPVRELPMDRLYEASRTPELVLVPKLTFLMVDGSGDPNTSPAYRDAIQALYGLSYTLHFALKKELGVDERVGPLEGLWWSDDMADFPGERKGDWSWTAMIAQPDAVTPEWFERARADVRRKKGPSAALEHARLETFEERLAAQVLYLGPYSDEGPTIVHLHEFIHELGYTFDGRREKHHEIYLGDPRRSAPEKLRTIIRQPVAAA
jgi:hypothetical protein